jgi:hypothetical protein
MTEDRSGRPPRRVPPEAGEPLVDEASVEAPLEAPGAAIDRLATELEGVVRREGAGVGRFERGDVAFATREGSRHCFRLRPEIVAAGLRTPGTAESARGGEWICLDTSTSDEFTLDRAKAWFELAWRLAGGGKRPVTVER